MSKIKLVRELLNQAPFNKIDGVNDILNTKNFPSKDPETANIQFYTRILTIYNKLTPEQQLTLHENRKNPQVKKFIKFIRECQNNIFDQKAEVFYDSLQEDFELKKQHRKKTGR